LNPQHSTVRPDQLLGFQLKKNMQWKGDNLEGTEIGPRSRTNVVLDEKSSNLMLVFHWGSTAYIGAGDMENG
jgi:hypothetical protein